MYVVTKISALCNSTCEDCAGQPAMIHVAVQTRETEGDVFGRELNFRLRMCARTTASSRLERLAARRPQHDQRAAQMTASRATFKETRCLFLPRQEFHDTEVVTFFFSLSFQLLGSVEGMKKKKTSRNKSTRKTPPTWSNLVPSEPFTQSVLGSRGGEEIQQGPSTL